MSPLGPYLRAEQFTQAEFSELLHISGCTLRRYINNERKPTLQELLRICNTLRISVHNFIHHADLTMRITAFPEETFQPIRFRQDAIVRFGAERHMTQKEIAHEVSQHCGRRYPESTLVRIKNGKVVTPDFLVDFLNCYDQTLDTLFDDPQVTYEEGDAQEVRLPYTYVANWRRAFNAIKKDNDRMRMKLREYQANERNQGADVVSEPAPPYQCKAGESPELPLPNMEREIRLQRILNRLENCLRELRILLSEDLV